MQQRITKRVVDGAEPREKRYVIFDSEVRGFGLRVSPTGSKSWIFEYRAGGGGRTAKKERITIGKVGDLTPDQARKVADRHRTTVKTGGDPQAEKTAWRRSMSVQQVVDAFLEHIKEDRSENTYQSYEGVLRLYLLPAVGTKKARDVDHADIEKIRLSLRDKPARANTLIRVVSSMYNYASNAARQWVPKGANPATDIERYPEHERKVKISDNELARLGATLRLAETDGLPWNIDEDKQTKHLPTSVEHTSIIEPSAIAAIRLLIFTGARLREILRLKWEDVDIDEDGVLTIWKHKTARQSGEKTIVINEPAALILEALIDERRGVYVIEGANVGEPDEAPRSDLKRPWEAVRSHAGLPHLRLHDLRHIFGGVGAGADMGLPLIGSLLGHASVQSTQRYAHAQRSPQRVASEAIAAKLAQALDGNHAPKSKSKSKSKPKRKNRPRTVS